MKMIKVLKVATLGVLGVIAILVLVSFLLPAKYKISREITIDAPDSVIYNLTANLEHWDIWTAWNKTLDSTVIFNMTGKDGQIGTTRGWNGKVIGNGELVITELKNNSLLGYNLSFQKGKYRSKGEIILQPSGESTKVIWTDEGDLGYNPVNRYFGLFMDRMMGPDFEKGLNKLKMVAEERKLWPAISVINIPAQHAVVIRDSAGPRDYSAVMGKGYFEISSFIQKNRLKAIGHPFAVFLKWDSLTQFSVMDLGMAVEEENFETAGRLTKQDFPEHWAVVARYFGPYDKTASTYYAIEKYCQQENFQIIGGPKEVYVTDPMVEKDPLKVETDIEFPVKRR